jgi:protease II
VAFEEDAYSVSILDSGDWAAPLLRLSYTSFTTPHTVLDIHMFTQRRVVRSVTAVGGGFRPTDYRSYRLWATADDGVDVPLSLVYRLDTFGRDGLNPALLMVYGAYGELQRSLCSRAWIGCAPLLCCPTAEPVLAHTLPLMHWRARAAFATVNLCWDARA